ncbi:MAG: hypothetical protein R3C18_13995 [Planctomycetaceae bacterium]
MTASINGARGESSSPDLRPQPVIGRPVNRPHPDQPPVRFPLHKCLNDVMTSAMQGSDAGY